MDGLIDERLLRMRERTQQSIRGSQELMKRTRLLLEASRECCRVSRALLEGLEECLVRDQMDWQELDRCSSLPDPLLNWREFLVALETPHGLVSSAATRTILP
jgi:hypothetical protein